jgi:FixJ family two-component response regulator
VKDADAIVFVVDDDPSIREAIKSLVSLVGLRVEPSAARRNSCETNGRICRDAWCSMWSCPD